MPHLHEPSYMRDLGDGLRLRWSTSADTEGVVELFSMVFRETPEESANARNAIYMRDQMSGLHPLTGPDRIALVEDTRTGKIVSASTFMTQTWEYDGIPFEVGRAEPVATHWEYRNRGLVRATFELWHARSAALGHLAQAITGIRYYYRQFGYEYALDQGGDRSMLLSAVPKLKEGQTEPYTMRVATPEQLPAIGALYDHDRARYTVSAWIDPRYLRFLLDIANPNSGEGLLICRIADIEDRQVGYAFVRRTRGSDGIVITGLGFETGVSPMAVLPSVLRALAELAPTLDTWKPEIPPATRIVFVLGSEHPVYTALGNLLAGRVWTPYAWYVRVPDLPALIRHIAPALERRLASSVAVGYTGELKLEFYRSGLRLAFENGRLTTAEEWRPSIWKPGTQAGFPPLVFLQLLFGRRSLSQLEDAFPDAWSNDDIRPILEALFPKQPVWVLPLD